MSRKIGKFSLFVSISLLILGGLFPNSVKAISADEYKSSVSKKIIELNFDVPKVSKYIIKMVNTSDQSLSCKIQSYSIAETLNDLNNSKTLLENQVDDTKNMDPEFKKKWLKAKEETKRTISESNYQVLDQRLRLIDSVCK